ncbi:MAG: hypothetical protein ABI946_00905 [Chthoniobacterales bacterium]
MYKRVSRTERTIARFVLGSIGGLVMLVLVCWGGSKLYGEWQERHALRRAAAFLSGGDVKAAALSARRAFQLNPHSLEAVRMLATIQEVAAVPTALDWRRMAVQMAPGSAADKIALASCALKFAEIPIAAKTLAEVGEGDKTVAYHAAAGQLAEAQNKLQEAREHWARAAQLAPGEKEYEMRLATVKLRLPDPADREMARATLQELRKVSGQRTAATRALIADGANRRSSQVVLKLAQELKDYPEASFQDALLYLDILKQLRHPDYTSYLTEIETKAAANANDLALLIAWMNKNKLSALALNYTNGLDAKILNVWPVPLTIAESYSNLSDWAGLEALAKAHPWEGFEFLRHAYLARAFREQGQSVAAEREWTAAKKEASGQAKLVSALVRTVIEWRWVDEAADLLWTLTKDPAQKEEALSSLYRYYSEAGDTGGLFRTLLRLVEIMPQDLSLQNNMAQLGLLLGAEPERVRKIAADLHRKEPKNPAFLSTYAFSLYSKGDAAGAVEAMAALPQEKLREPAYAAYYGVFLAAAGETEKAWVYLQLGSGVKLLPEEKALLEKAQSKIAAPAAE